MNRKSHAHVLLVTATPVESKAALEVFRAATKKRAFRCDRACACRTKYRIQVRAKVSPSAGWRLRLVLVSRFLAVLKPFRLPGKAKGREGATPTMARQRNSGTVARSPWIVVVWHRTCAILFGSSGT